MAIGLAAPELALNLTTTNTEKPVTDVGNPNLNRFAEVATALDALRREGTVSAATRNYLFDQELTAAWEAATGNKGALSITHTDYDPNVGFHSNGYAISPMLDAGLSAIDNMQEKARTQGKLLEAHTYRIEGERRQVEKEEDQSLLDGIQSGEFTPKHTYIYVSPYPEEMDQEVAQELGYGSRTSMLRSHTIDARGRKTVSQIKLYNTDITLLADVIKDFADPAELALKAQADERLRPLERYCNGEQVILCSSDLLYAHSVLHLHQDDLPLGVTELAMSYDRKLAAVTGKNHFFGKETSSPRAADDYERIHAWNTEITTRSEPVIQSLVDFDIRLAEALHAGSLEAFPDLHEKVNYYLQLQDETGDAVLTPYQKSIIAEGLNGSFTEAAATELSTMEKIRSWALIAVLTGHKAAYKMFGEDFVTEVQKMDTSNAMGLLRTINFDQKTLTAEQIWLACGMKVSMGTRPSLPLLGLRGEVEALFDEPDLPEPDDNNLTIGSLTRSNKIFICEGCRYFHMIDARTGNLHSGCLGCGSAANC